MHKFLATVMIATLAFATTAVADPGEGFGLLYAHGDIYRTHGVPAATPMGGKDTIYSIVDGAEGQLSVSAVAPGDRDYHGGLWAVNVVMWTMGVEPYLLTSEEEVIEAWEAGDISIARMADADFRCPMHPGRPNR